MPSDAGAPGGGSPDKGTPTDDGAGLFSRDEILGGRAGAGADQRRARAIVYLIEQEAQRSGDRSSSLAAMGTAAASMGGATVDLESMLDAEARRGALPGEADEAFVASFRAARRGAGSPALRRLNDQAPAWVALVPQRADLRARVLDLLSQRYELTERNARGILANLGANDPAFAATFARVAGRPLNEAVAPGGKGLLGRLRRR